MRMRTLSSVCGKSRKHRFVTGRIVVVSLAALLGGCSQTMKWTVISLAMVPTMLIGVPILMLMSAESGVTSAQFSVSGDDLLIVHRVRNRSQVFRYEPANENWIPLTDDWGFAFDANYSPDGSRIAYCVRKGKHRSHLHIMDRDGRNSKQITYGRRRDEKPRFSPDGTRIVFSSEIDGGGADLFVYEVEAGSLQSITDDPDVHDARPWFVSDTEAILFIRGTPDAERPDDRYPEIYDYALCVTTLSGEQTMELTEYELDWDVSMGVSRHGDKTYLVLGDQYARIYANAFGPEEALALFWEPIPGPFEGATRYFVSPDWPTALAVVETPRQYAVERGHTHLFAWYTLYAVDLDNWEERKIAITDDPILEPKYSFDGRTIGYHVLADTRLTKRHAQFWIAPESGGVRRIDTTHPESPKWAHIKTK